MHAASVLITHVVATAQLWERALELAIEHDHPVYDMCFVALANGDGRVDIVVPTTHSLHYVFFHQGGKSFTNAQYFTHNGNSPHAAIANLNGDGRPDAVVSEEANFGGVSVLLTGSCLQ